VQLHELANWYQIYVEVLSSRGRFRKLRNAPPWKIVAWMFPELAVPQSCTMFGWLGAFSGLVRAVNERLAARPCIAQHRAAIPEKCQGTWISRNVMWQPLLHSRLHRWPPSHLTFGRGFWPNIAFERRVIHAGIPQHQSPSVFHAANLYLPSGFVGILHNVQCRS
jgi:hypothetical protein